MMTCHYFRANLQPGNADAAMLEHLRHCDACLDFAMSVDPDLFFRSLGGDELVPPGGVDAFVGDVMSQVRVRNAETSLAPRHAVSRWQRWAIAAMAIVGITGATLAYRYEHAAPAPQPVHLVAAAKPRPTATATKSFVETYSSHNATIVEMPSDGSDTKVVMIFDDKLPADL
ncbi:MAG: hypothetical protein QOE82_291 [Thermoanaerobaculia bacterium]|jgi:hypothetical protein|nr:hypothetical protein [Thermoanaerobaculia bacterium]